MKEGTEDTMKNRKAYKKKREIWKKTKSFFYK